MQRLIDAQELDMRLSRQKHYAHENGWHPQYVRAMADAQRELRMCETTEPVRHGHWIPCTKTGMPLTEYGRRQGEKWFGYKCSECNTIYKGNALTESPYCQHCGSKMDEPTQ